MPTPSPIVPATRLRLISPLTVMGSAVFTVPKLAFRLTSPPKPAGAVKSTPPNELRTWALRSAGPAAEQATRTPPLPETAERFDAVTSVARRLPKDEDRSSVPVCTPVTSTLPLPEFSVTESPWRSPAAMAPNEDLASQTPKEALVIPIRPLPLLSFRSPPEKSSNVMAPKDVSAVVGAVLP